MKNGREVGIVSIVFTAIGSSIVFAFLIIGSFLIAMLEGIQGLFDTEYSKNIIDPEKESDIV